MWIENEAIRALQEVGHIGDTYSKGLGTFLHVGMGILSIFLGNTGISPKNICLNTLQRRIITVSGCSDMENQKLMSRYPERFVFFWFNYSDEQIFNPMPQT